MRNSLSFYHVFLNLQKEEELRESLKFANACGALTVTERGAIQALPTKETVLNAILKPVS
jgi:fructokinase